MYSSSSVTGFGTHATANVVVGQGSSVIDFEIVNSVRYGNGQILTVAMEEQLVFQLHLLILEMSSNLTIDEVHVDEFTGWTVGTLDVLDRVDEY